MTTTWRAFIEGKAAPQGSKRHVGGGRMIEASKYLPKWRKHVTNTVLPLAPEEPLDGPLQVDMLFYMERPKTVRRDYPTVVPDLSKLVRAVEDSLTDAGIWADDARVVDMHAAKAYADALRPPGVSVVVSKMI